jgi:magnesium-transporting ATPase (P-type)
MYDPRVIKFFKVTIAINIALFIFDFAVLQDRQLMLLNLMSGLLCCIPLYRNNKANKNK